ncbi:MAG TPA: hypothetical protein VFQ61_03795 [Polyangiaceae bacterium]|nr:hypothetical protein [Polyangiaceae bacterium]
MSISSRSCGRTTSPGSVLGRAHRAAALLLVGALAAACTVGEGQGFVSSKKLHVDNCWDGPFDLYPDFFAANPDSRNALAIRVQRGDNIAEQSDGLHVLVTELQDLRARLEEPLAVGLPRGVSPPGVPIQYQSDPPKVSLALYLHNSCHAEAATVYSLSGQITFHALFSGNPNEGNAENRLTSAEFTDVVFGDPRRVTGNAEQDAASQSLVSGKFSFYFQRGQPAQPFP